MRCVTHLIDDAIMSTSSLRSCMQRCRVVVYAHGNLQRTGHTNVDVPLPSSSPSTIPLGEGEGWSASFRPQLLRTIDVSSLGHVQDMLFDPIDDKLILMLTSIDSEMSSWWVYDSFLVVCCKLSTISSLTDMYFTSPNQDFIFEMHRINFSLA